ncbi:MAG: RNA-binding protein [Oscillatoria sp. PMC 1068.18]|nr:RNA-binding protein [Oscillatoria sp. PMC 1076.18]MEC4988960.1 RNA-binding protein [Oscillatoria sp. PMC 1068.18]
MSVRLYVGNLPKEPVERQELQTMFAEVGENVSTKVIKDRKTGKCRGFAFVTVPNDEMADELISKFNGQPFMDSSLKIEKALPRSKSKTSPNEAPARSGGSGGNSSGRRGGKKSKRSSSNSPDTGAVQPDPRWADELAKLKEMLAAQTSNS